MADFDVTESASQRNIGAPDAKHAGQIFCRAWLTTKPGSRDAKNFGVLECFP